jgi:hypothetical protein
MNAMNAMNAIDQCRECGGRLTVLSLDRQERMRRRIGQALVVKCAGCGSESVAVKKAWFEFVASKRSNRKQSQERSQASQASQADRTGQTQLSLF